MFKMLLTALAVLSAVTSVMASPITVNATAIAARDPPLVGGFINHCNLIVVIEFGSDYGHVHADCALDPSIEGSEIYSSLDLSLCMGNYNNHLAWGYLGGAMSSCKNCASRMWDTQYIDCDCGTLDLNDGIYMADNGALACYDQVAEPHIVPT